MIPTTVSEHLAVLADGLQPRATQPARVAVVGAGMAGLVAASELLRAGHDPIVLEAQHRVGGRVLTLRDRWADGLWAEAGAMRIPRSHAITHALIDRYGLATKPFTMDNAEAYCFFGGRKVRHRELAGDPRGLGFEVLPNESVAPAQLWNAELEPFAAHCASTVTTRGSRSPPSTTSTRCASSSKRASGRRARSRCSVSCSTKRRS